MLFMRPATKEDFIGLDIEYDHGRMMSENVKRLIEKGNLQEAIVLFKKETYLGLLEAKKYCLVYEKYTLAKQDFESGKPVFVSY